MLYDCKRISYWIDRRLTGLAGPDYAATISFGLPFEPEDSQYGECRVSWLRRASGCSGEVQLILDDVVADVSSQLDAQAELGIQVTRQNEVPEVGPTNAGVWFQIPQVTAIFADLKASTELSATRKPESRGYRLHLFHKGDGCHP